MKKYIGFALVLMLGMGMGSLRAIDLASEVEEAVQNAAKDSASQADHTAALEALQSRGLSKYQASMYLETRQNLLKAPKLQTAAEEKLAAATPKTTTVTQKITSVFTTTPEESAVKFAKAEAAAAAKAAKAETAAVKRVHAAQIKFDAANQDDFFSPADAMDGSEASIQKANATGAAYRAAEKELTREQTVLSTLQHSNKMSADVRQARQWLTDSQNTLKNLSKKASKVDRDAAKNAVEQDQSWLKNREDADRRAWRNYATAWMRANPGKTVTGALVAAGVGTAAAVGIAEAVKHSSEGSSDATQTPTNETTGSTSSRDVGGSADATEPVVTE